MKNKPPRDSELSEARAAFLRRPGRSGAAIRARAVEKREGKTQPGMTSQLLALPPSRRKAAQQELERLANLGQTDQRSSEETIEQYMERMRARPEGFYDTKNEDLASIAADLIHDLFEAEKQLPVIRGSGTGEHVKLGTTQGARAPQDRATRLGLVFNTETGEWESSPQSTVSAYLRKQMMKKLKAEKKEAEKKEAENSSVDYRTTDDIRGLIEDRTSSKQAIRDRKKRWGKPGSGKQLAGDIMRGDVKTSDYKDPKHPRGEWVRAITGPRRGALIWVAADYGRYQDMDPDEQTKAVNREDSSVSYARDILKAYKDISENGVKYTEQPAGYTPGTHGDSGDEGGIPANRDDRAVARASRTRREKRIAGEKRRKERATRIARARNT